MKRKTDKLKFLLAIVSMCCWSILGHSIDRNEEVTVEKVKVFKTSITVFENNQTDGHSNYEEKEEPGSLMSPSSRSKNHWAVYSEEDEINTFEREEREYASAIKKIKAIERRKNFEEKKTWIEKITTADYMEIFISGGGYENSIDPVVTDRIMISNSGLLQKLYQTENAPAKKVTKQIDREELVELIKWIAGKGFFTFDSEYECSEEDLKCLQRLEMRPTPIPLKIVVAVGPYRNVVSVPIFAPNMNKDEYIEYPEELKKIAEAIYVFASL